MLREMSKSMLGREESRNFGTINASLKTESIAREQLPQSTLNNNLSPDQTPEITNTGNQGSLLGSRDLPHVDTLMEESVSSGVVIEDQGTIQEEVESNVAHPPSDNVSISMENNILAEPNCRFSNRRRPGASLKISTHTYDKLIRGDKVSFINSNSSSFMTVKIGTNSRVPTMKVHTAVNRPNVVELHDIRTKYPKHSQADCDKEGSCVVQSVASSPLTSMQFGKVDEFLGESVVTPSHDVTLMGENMASTCKHSVQQEKVLRRSLSVHHSPFKFVNYEGRKSTTRKCSCVYSSTTTRQLSSPNPTTTNRKRQCHTYTNKLCVCRFQQRSGFKRKTTPAPVDCAFNPPVKKLYLNHHPSSIIMPCLSVFSLFLTNVQFQLGAAQFLVTRSGTVDSPI